MSVSLWFANYGMLWRFIVCIYIYMYNMPSYVGKNGGQKKCTLHFGRCHVSPIGDCFKCHL